LARTVENVVAQGFPKHASHAETMVKDLGVTPYADTLAAMRVFTAARNATTADEIWLTEHAPVYTLGLAGKPEHVLNPGGIAVVQSDRGGQVTYHGPGQLVAYLLLDLRRRDLTVRAMVSRIEQAAIEFLQGVGITGQRRTGMPGVYVGEAKIAALGLKVKGGCSYHGVSLNVDMDLTPFAGINPCGYAGMAVTSMAACGVRRSVAAVKPLLAASLQANLQASVATRPMPRGEDIADVAA